MGKTIKAPTTSLLHVNSIGHKDIQPHALPCAR